MQQSSECDSSSRLCMDSDAIASTYSANCMFMHAHLCISVCICAMLMISSLLVSLGALLLLDITEGSIALGDLLYLPSSAGPSVSSSPPSTPPESTPPDRNVIKKGGGLWPPLPKTVHTNHIRLGGKPAGFTHLIFISKRASFFFLH